MISGPAANAQRTRSEVLLVGALVAMAVVVLVRTAWISDDAAITVRTVLNLLHGYGPNFNVGERVQAYTHPLWFLMLALVSVIVSNSYIATFLLSIATSLLVFWLVVAHVATGTWQRLFAGGVLLLSKAYVDFSTSGLENPLSHLLIVASVISGLRALSSGNPRDSLVCILSVGLLYLSRADLLLLIAPFFGLVVWRIHSTFYDTCKALAVAALPALLWTGFSLFYYGFPFPNTAYAKLGTGIPFVERAEQGAFYVLDSMLHDPLTLVVVALAILATLRAPAELRAMGAGMLLYLLYVVSVGGDFMSGRFFTAPLLVAVLVILSSSITKQQGRGILVCLVLLGLVNINSTLLSGKGYQAVQPGDSFMSERPKRRGIEDERGFYYQQYGLWSAGLKQFVIPGWRTEGRQTLIGIACGGIGHAGIHAGPNAFLIDTCGLADPLMARLPSQYDPHWRVGHYRRQLPTDYADTAMTGRNLLTDPRTRQFYESIRTVTRAPLSDARRVVEVLRLNLGLVEPPQADYYRYFPIPRSSKAPAIRVADVESRTVTGGKWDAEGNILFPRAIEIVLPLRRKIAAIDLSLRGTARYEVEALGNGDYFRIGELASDTDVHGSMVRHVLRPSFPLPTDRVRITAIGQRDGHSLGHFKITSSP